MQVVVIGANTCGAKAACRVKRLNPKVEVILIDKDDLISYGACGIPYFVSGDVPNENALRETPYHVVRDENFFRNVKELTVLTKTLAEEIDRKRKTVRVRYLDSGKIEEIPYDKLVIATGSKPRILNLPGIDLEGVYSLSNLHKAIEIKEKIAKGEVERPLVIGAGLIGLEMTEAFADLWGLPVTLLEYFPQVLPKNLDPFTAKIVENHLKDKGINLVLNARIKEIVGKEGRVIGVKTEREFYPADLVLMAVGVEPNTELAKKAGLLVSPLTGGIMVNERLQTSDPDIYAGGDCIEVTHLITGKKVVMPMGSLANRQGRVIGTNIAGGVATFKGTVGAFIMKCFDLSVGGAGLTLSQAKAEGFFASYALNNQTERSHFYPGAEYAYYALIFDKKTTRILGFQAVGPFTDGTLARIHAISSILPYKPLIEDLINLELAYSPPFNTPLDPIHDTAHVADNILRGLFEPIDWEEVLKRMKEGDPNSFIIDLRHPKEAEYLVKNFSNVKNIQEFRYHLDKIPKDKDIILICNTSRRAYEVARLLKAEGFERVYLPLGGFSFPRKWGELVK
ncbi:MAG: FAD-dependent oxidoreductase [Caldimicrobium sp.]|jgi:NADPH-dependent 2,4-dienoyl-CoA reductase/sulfur reductase-like enzyme/rhodanese-related sulfurtransferase